MTKQYITLEKDPPPLIKNQRNKKTTFFIREFQVRDFIAEMIDVGNNDINFYSVGVPEELHKEPSVEDFYAKYIAGGAIVLLTHNSDITKEDGLKHGFYVAVRDPYTFARFVSNINVVLGGIHIDARFDKRYLRECLKLVAESMYTKNKKIAFTSKLNNAVLYGTKQQYEEVVAIASNLRSLL